MDDSLIFMNFNSYMSIGLSRNCSRLYKCAGRGLLVHIVTTLGGGHIRHYNVAGVHNSWPYSRSIEFLLPPSHRLIIELSALFLNLVITHIKSVATKAMISHSHVICSKLKSALNLTYSTTGILIYDIELIIISASRPP